MSGLPVPTFVSLLTTPFLIAIGQVLFKITSEKLVVSGNGVTTVFFDPLFILALTIYGSATLLWIYVLKSVPLAYAYSFMALTFVLVPLLAAFLMGETVTLKYAIGAALVITGLVVIQS